MYIPAKPIYKHNGEKRIVSALANGVPFTFLKKPT